MRGFWVVYNLIPEMIERVDKAIDAAARKAAFDCEAAAKSLAPVDTGFLKSSIYTRTRNYSGYGHIDQPPRDGALFPDRPPPVEPVQAEVAVGAIYGQFVEYGTSKASAQPFLTPAAEMAGPAYVAALEAIMAGIFGGQVSGGVSVEGMGMEGGGGGGE